MKLPKSIVKLIDQFSRLPGIGPKTAQRLVFHLLHFPTEDINRFSDSLKELKQNITLCTVCKNVCEGDICEVCKDDSRNKNLIAVVSSSLDAFAFEKTGFKGVYHVLHGLIDPLNNYGPEDIFLFDLINRLKNEVTQNSLYFDNLEIVLATNTTMEGESTALYISKLIKDTFESVGGSNIKLTRIARGLPVGGDIEYADDITLSRALEGRISF